MKTLVMKFGGTSVGSAEAIQRLTQIVHQTQAEWPRIAVVVSAMSGITDSLLACANHAIEGDVIGYQALIATMRSKHLAALRELTPENAEVEQIILGHLSELNALCHAVSVLGEATPRALDAIASLGERMSAPLVAMGLKNTGISAVAVDAAEVIVTDAVFQSASPDFEATQARAEAVLRPILDSGAVPVVTGFVGATKNGITTTLGRGGSDFSGAIIGVALAADEVWIWTDVNGVMTADPRVVKTARTLPALTFREISELAFYGAKVLHPKTIRPVIERDIALWIKNTFNPEGASTQVVSDEQTTGGGVINAVTAFKSHCIITLAGRGMLGIPGIAARTFAAVARTKTSVVMISQASSEQSICFVVPYVSCEAVTHALEEEFRLELERRDIDQVVASPECAVVTVVGAGMKHTPGVAGKIFSALGAANVNVVAIAQGSSECSVSLVVDAPQADEAVRAIHQMI